VTTTSTTIDEIKARQRRRRPTNKELAAAHKREIEKMTSTTKIEFRNPFLCPNCGKENARWNTEREQVECPDCGQETPMDEYAIAEARREEEEQV
jgi:predicted RNA-binding Zn-ribbon protein involved in translation (DUF1610 family)